MGATQSIERCDGCNFIIEDRELVASGQCNPDLATKLLGVPPDKVGPGTSLKKIFGTAPRAHHISCADITFKGIDSSHPASWRTFEPGPHEDERRRKWLLEQLVNGSGQQIAMPGSLESVPHAPLFREIVANWNRALWSEGKTFNSYINLSGSVWAMHIEFEGQRYIKGFTSDPVGDKSPIYRPGRTHIDALYVAENHMGVVEVIFGNSCVAPAVPYKPDVYWKSLVFPDLGGCFKALSDGVKVRALVTVYANNTSRPGSETSSALPQPPSMPLRCFPPGDWGDAPKHVKVFRFNEPNTSGYSFCWNNKQVSIHVHKLREQNVTFFDPHPSHGSSAVWQYLPIERGEYISMIWHHYHEDRRNVYLSLKTNKNHVIRLGAHINMSGKSLENVIVYRPPKRSACIYYKERPANINCIAFEGANPFEHIPGEQAPGLPTPPFQREECPADFFCSTLWLKEIIDITPSMKTVSGVQIITGMIVTYLDGHQEAVGQVKYNSLGDVIDAIDGKEIWFRFVKIGGHYPNVAEIRLSPPRRPRRRHGEPSTKRTCERRGSNENRCWLRLSLFTTLEWWFSDNSSILRAKDRRSPLLKIRDPLRLASLEMLNSGAGPSSRVPGFEYEEDFGDLEDPWPFD